MRIRGTTYRWTASADVPIRSQGSADARGISNHRARSTGPRLTAALRVTANLLSSATGNDLRLSPIGIGLEMWHCVSGDPGRRRSARLWFQGNACGPHVRGPLIFILGSLRRVCTYDFCMHFVFCRTCSKKAALNHLQHFFPRISRPVYPRRLAHPLLRPPLRRPPSIPRARTPCPLRTNRPHRP